MYGGLGEKEGSSSNACKILLSWTQLDVGRHGQLLAVEAVFRPIRVDVADVSDRGELREYPSRTEVRRCLNAATDWF